MFDFDGANIGLVSLLVTGLRKISCSDADGDGERALMLKNKSEMRLELKKLL